ncbi:hypothetical protein [Lactobacillus bombicola]|uniref:Uncharacterized protein n=1 Tax=Lactobacillus bombicola TaxID=1505723 RepID=A0A396SXF9_9LACO|nr:hypothetical protein [Lactobacillus bombicola]RHW54279.1 hypothetical protein DS835_04305 [Lactobacillus bombicola]
MPNLEKEEIKGNRKGFNEGKIVIENTTVHYEREPLKKGSEKILRLNLSDSFNITGYPLAFYNGKGIEIFHL